MSELLIRLVIMIIKILAYICGAALCVQASIGLGFLISSVWEKEKRASLFAALQFAVMLAVALIYFFLLNLGFFQTGTGQFILLAGIVCSAAVAVLLLKKAPPNARAVNGTKGLIVGEVDRFDERDQVFARNRALHPGSEQYEIYYKMHPEKEDFDARRREVGGPNGPMGLIDRPHDTPNVAAAAAYGSMAMFLADSQRVTPQPLPPFKNKKVTMSPEEAAQRIKGHALNIGADVVGITEINPLWVYSIRGEIFHENWEDWGQEINLDHRYAVVFGTEMPLELIGPSPHTPSTIASQTEYAKDAFIADMLAQYIANLGYSATANHLRHYDAMMVPLAVDAGLGELSRMGYLITDSLGPRLRLAAVTTDLPLATDTPVDIGVEDFCRICRKCATCCPSNSIPMEDQAVDNGILRWKLNAETCFEYWGKVGTGCNICMRVCPWSHARTWPHWVIVWMITRNPIARRLFNLMDDIFYGRKPKPKVGPVWTKYQG